MTSVENRLGHRYLNTSENIQLSLQHASANNSAVVYQQNASNNAKNAKKFSIIHAFVPSFILVVITLIITAIFILESESEIIAPIRNFPEMISLKYQYYQPIKNFILRLMSN